MKLRIDGTSPRGNEVAQEDGGHVGLVADWRDMILVHFKFDPAVLQPHVPLPIDVYQGNAYMSVLSFSLNRMRPKGTGLLGRAAFRVLSDHPFLNVRTYVRGQNGPGIFFVREWINNPLAQLLGPALYGLPYELAHFRRAKEGGGTESIRVKSASDERELRVLVPSQATPAHEAKPGSLDEFLVERYVAYTHRRGRTRSFFVKHPRWQLEDLDWVRVQTDLLETAFPWFALGRCVCAQRSRGFQDVFMSPPRSCRVDYGWTPETAAELSSV